MADEITKNADVFGKQVLMDLVENYAKTEAALIGMGIATDASNEIKWDEEGGDDYVIRPELRTNLTAQRLNAARTGLTTQKVSSVPVRYPVVRSIVTLAYQGESVEKFWGSAGFMGSVNKLMKEKVVDDLDLTMLDYTADIGDGETNYGAAGTDLIVDVTTADVKTMTFDTLARAAGKFGDSKGSAVAVLNSKCFTDLVTTTEAKNVQQGVVLPNGMNGIYLPTIGVFATKSDRITADANGVYANKLCRLGAMSYGWRSPLAIIPHYVGEYTWNIDFVWGYVIMRNQKNAKEQIVSIKTLTDQTD